MLTILALWPLAIAAAALFFGTLGHANDAAVHHYGERGFFDSVRSHGGEV